VYIVSNFIELKRSLQFLYHLYSFILARISWKKWALEKESMQIKPVRKRKLAKNAKECYFDIWLTARFESQCYSRTILDMRWKYIKAVEPAEGLVALVVKRSRANPPPRPPGELLFYMGYIGMWDPERNSVWAFFSEKGYVIHSSLAMRNQCLQGDHLFPQLCSPSQMFRQMETNSG